MDKVKPRLLKGMQDSWPQLALARRLVVRRVEEVCRSFGFVPFDTPALEATESLLGPVPTPGQRRNIFTFNNQDGEDVGLRFDLTVPLARVVAGYQELAKPFRRYQCGNVYRYDKPEPGRFREFMQFDLDIVGAPELSADAEIIAAIYAILSALCAGGFTLRFSTRKLLNAVGEFSGAPPEKARSVYRVIDKLDKFDRERIRQELGSGLTDESGDRIDGLGLDDKMIARIDAFLDLPNDGDAGASLAAARELLGGNALAVEALDELEKLTALVQAFGVPLGGPSVAAVPGGQTPPRSAAPPDTGEGARATSDARATGRAILDLHLARGLGYYSGPVFEAVLDALPSFGSVFGGGRYDNLVDRFEVVGVAAGQAANIPATGASVGVDRLLAALDALGVDLLGGEGTGPQVLITVMDPERMAEYIAMACELREAGIRTELWQGGKAGLNKQLKHADRTGARLAVIAGSDEFERGVVSVKDLAAGKQLAGDSATREEWLSKEKRPQVELARAGMAEAVQAILATE